MPAKSARLSSDPGDPDALANGRQACCASGAARPEKAAPFEISFSRLRAYLNALGIQDPLHRRPAAAAHASSSLGMTVHRLESHREDTGISPGLSSMTSISTTRATRPQVAQWYRGEDAQTWKDEGASRSLRRAGILFELAPRVRGISTA